MNPHYLMAWLAVTVAECTAEPYLPSEIAPTTLSAEDMRARAKSAREQGNNLDEAATFQDLLTLLPEDREAVRGRVLAASRMGASHLALEYARLHISHFSEVELQTLEKDVIGRNVQWGRLESEQDSTPGRFNRLDKVIGQSASANDADADADVLVDRIVALQSRGRAREAVEVYEYLKARRPHIPAYGLAAAAGAYLSLQQPELARDLYLQAIAFAGNAPENTDQAWHFGLFDAYVECNDIAAAIRLAKELQSTIPPFAHAGLPGVERDNDAYGRARVIAAMAYLYGDAPMESENLFEQILSVAPFNIAARIGYAELLLARQQPRAAQDEFARALVDDPTHTEAALGLAQTALALHEPGSARLQVDALIRHFPDSSTTLRAQRELMQYSAPSLSAQSNWGRSDAAVNTKATRDWSLEATLHSASIADNWRIFGHWFQSQAHFADEVASRRRLGLGGDYRSTNWNLIGELDQDAGNLDAMGITLRVALLPTDQWRVRMEFESNSNEVPLRAEVAGTRIEGATVRLTYRRNESREIEVSFGDQRFTDGNRRRQTAATWFERWMTGPVYKLETHLILSASTNTLDDADYFAPSRDGAVELKAVNEWMPWRRYERAFKHRLALSYGQYRQSGFASNPIYGFEYEHEWDIDNQRSLRYGLARVRQSFDGLAENRTSIFLDLNWRF